MDNDNKIINSVKKESETHDEVQLFLKDELKTLAYSAAAAYNLEQEYAKTRKNKRKDVYVILGACFLVVVLLTVGLSCFIGASNNKIKVNIDTFDDLNLRALLNSAGRVESLYENAVRTRDSLVAQRDDKLTAAEQKRENDLYTLKSVSKVSSKSALAEKQALIQAEYKEAVKAVKEKYDQKIADAEKEVNEYKDQIMGFDSEKLSAAQQDEAALDSQKILNDMERKNLEKRYQDQIKDLKTQMALQQREAVKQQREAVEEVRRIYQTKIDLLDPDARSQSKVQDKIILGTGIPKSLTGDALEFKEHFDGNKYTGRFSSPSESFKKSVNQSSEYLESFNTIANRFYSIPLENSIRQYVPAMQRLAYQITTDMAEGQTQMQSEIEELQKTVKQKENEISGLSFYFDQLCNTDKANIADGVIINASNKFDLVLYMSKNGKEKMEGNPVQEGVIRDSRKVLAEVTITKNGTMYSASPKSDTKNTSLDGIIAGQRVFIVTK